MHRLFLCIFVFKPTSSLDFRCSSFSISTISSSFADRIERRVSDDVVMVCVFFGVRVRVKVRMLVLVFVFLKKGFKLFLKI